MQVKLWICNKILEGSFFITDDDDDNDKGNNVSKSQV